jgi:hypothetical protein
MTTQNIYEGIGHIIHISTNCVGSCKDCDKLFNNFEESVNHFLKKHEYKLLHIGSETDSDLDGNPYHQTVAVVGK